MNVSNVNINVNKHSFDLRKIKRVEMNASLKEKNVFYWVIIHYLLSVDVVNTITFLLKKYLFLR